MPARYPFGLTDSELQSALDSMMDPASWPGFDDFPRILPELKLALLTAGLQERARRESNVSAERALRIAYLALLVALATLVVSIIVLVTAG